MHRHLSTALRSEQDAAAVAENDGLDMTTLGGGNKRRAAITVGTFEIYPTSECQLENMQMPSGASIEPGKAKPTADVSSCLILLMCLRGTYQGTRLRKIEYPSRDRLGKRKHFQDFVQQYPPHAFRQMLTVFGASPCLRPRPRALWNRSAAARKSRGRSPGMKPARREVRLPS